MKLSLLALAAAAGLASCQCVSSIPQCAQSCLLIGAASVGCGDTDYACQCTNDHQTEITNNATTCVLAACGEQVALNEVLPAADAFCSAINAGDTCSSASAGSTGTTASSGSSSTQASTLPTTVSLTSTATDATATTGRSSSATRTATTTETSGTGTGTGTATDASASASSTAGAATMGSVGSLGVAVLGALVML